MRAKKISILGGGISGLALGFFLRRKSPELEIELIEKEERLGGVIQTIRREDGIFEVGPRTFKTSRSGALLGLIQELEMEDQLIGSSPQSNQRYIWAFDQLNAITLNPFHYFTNPLTKIIWKALVQEPFRPVRKQDETVYEFGMRRFGEPFTKWILDPAMQGIYASSLTQLSADMALKTLKQWERDHGSLMMALFKERKRRERPQLPKAIQTNSLFTLRSGMSNLVEHLAKKARLKVTLGKEASEIPDSDHTFLAFSPDAWPSFWPKVQWPKWESGSLVVLNLGYKEFQLKQRGFGYLVPPCERKGHLGVIFDSELFPCQNGDFSTRITVMLGGGVDPDASGLSDEVLLSRALDELGELLGITAEPDFYHIARHWRALPLFEVGHREKIARCEALIAEANPRVTLLGNYFEGASVNHCIARAQRVAESF